MHVAVVWFKRDLRLVDHQPLQQALDYCRRHDCPLVGLYALEHDYWQLPDTSQRQWAFIYESLQALNQHWQQLGGAGLCFISTDLAEQLEKWQQASYQVALFSHQETGNFWTYQRDINVEKKCLQLGIRWQQSPQFGVLRPNPDRDQWAEHWQAFMQQAVISAPKHLQANASTCLLPGSHPMSDLPIDVRPSHVSHDHWPCPGRQSGGREQALALWQSFIDQRGRFYRSSISSPLTAEHACSRLSPHLALGTISVHELVQAVWQQRQECADRYFKRSLAAFESRLWWHCHFIQKLEDQPDMEWQPLHPAYRQLRSDINSDWQQAWQQGRTGWPLVDACMRYLHHHGWLNFRMRAMLMSIISYPLWQPWQPAAQFLAAQFVDYEPGIHYPQVQMQAGTTGINIPRIYNPTLQAQKLDPQGDFIRRWLPELRSVSNAWIHQPWLMPASQQRQCGVILGQHYPEPLVDFAKASRRAKAHITQLRDAEFMATARYIGHKHGSRKRSRRAHKKTANSQQLSLF